jgi:hypothetical protein
MLREQEFNSLKIKEDVAPASAAAQAAMFQKKTQNE